MVRPAYLPISLLSVLMLVSGAAAADLTNSARLGMNPSGVGYYRNSHWPFVDLWITSGAWEVDPGGTNPDGSLKPGVTGGKWIRQATRHFPTGRYKLSYEGSSRFWNIAVDAELLEEGDGYRIYNFHPDIRAGGEDGMYLFTNDTAHDLHNFSLRPVDEDNNEIYPGELFDPRFKERLQPFGSLRFSGWTGASHSGEVTWDQRPKPSDDRIDGRVPVEYMVQLCNEMDVVPWFSMPYAADDDYVRQFATHVRDNLASDGPIYVEYSNEVWHPNFNCHGHVEQLAAQNGTTWWVEWAEEAKRDFRIWHEVFEGQQDRIVRVAATQVSNRYHTPRFLEALNGEFDAISPTTYFSTDYSSSDTVDSIIDKLSAHIDQLSNPQMSGGEPTGDWVWHRQMADDYSQQLGRDIQLVAYEGGQHLLPTASSGPEWDKYVAVQRDPRMKDLYEQMLNAWYGHDIQGDLLMAFASVAEIAQYGAWGALEYQDQPYEDAPKYQAYYDFGNRLWVDPLPGDANCDGVVDAADIDKLRAQVESGLNLEAYDLNGDGLVDSDDVDVLVRDILGTEYGDANLDGQVSDADYTVWADHYGFTEAGWAQGDFNGNGTVTEADYTIWADHYGFQAPTGVPEPTTLGLLAVAAAALKRRRTQR